MQRKPNPLILSGIVILAISGGANAADSEREHQRRGPPPEAINACAAAVAGDACSFAGRRGDTVSGSCESRRNDELVCAPAGAPPRRGAADGRNDADDGNDSTE